RLDLAGTSVSLTGPISIPGTITAASSTALTANFNLAAAPVGSYHVSVINNLGSDLLTDALIVHSPGVLLTRSTQSTALDTDPAIPHTSGPMDTVVFVSNRGGTSELYLKNPLAPDTAPLTALTSLGSVANPSISPDGRKVVFESAGSLYVLNLQTLGAPTLLTTGIEPEWSPLGDLIAYRKSVGSGHAIHSIHPDGTGTLQLTSPVGVTIDSNPTWSPDGKRIAFLRDPSGTGAAPLLRVMPTSGGDGIGISSLSGIRDVSWSPEGRWIAASTNGSGNFRIHLVGSSGQGSILISQDATQDTKPCWNADGTQLSFSSTYAGNTDVYLLSGIAALADLDADLVPDPLDACAATAPVTGQIDRNFNGCGDPGSSFRFPRFWSADQLPISYQTTGTGDPRVTDGSEFGSLTDAFNAWAGVSGAGLSGGDDGSHSGSRNVVAADGKNSISFGDEDGFIPGTLAVTLSTVAEEDTVINGRWYRPGEIVDADILFNANDFHFSTATTIPTSDAYNLRAVATHEFGHFFGLSHSVVVGATMYAVVPRNTSAWSLERDDVSLLRRGYAADTTRSVDGRVLRSDGATPVVGAVVMAVASSAPTDTLQMTVTGVDGAYRFYDLDRSFKIFVTPLDGGDGVNELTASYINRDLVGLAETDFQPEFWDEALETNHDGGPGVITARPGPLVSNANVVL
ncbi:MAG TPA: matrixin family metalloprotease, partial [Candidatus Eisenbacteria bacterium]|nr:matrixin family metalloprotease [Candidatus Eisenbacteria bacterium]